jgi:hypothetical protein
VEEQLPVLAALVLLLLDEVLLQHEIYENLVLSSYMAQLRGNEQHSTPTNRKFRSATPIHLWVLN